MILARAAEEYPDQLTCDMMQYYHVADPDALPPSLFATLAAGLPEDSRTMRALSGQKFASDTLLLAAAVDRLSILAWFKTRDGLKGRNRPASLLERMTRGDKTKQAETKQKYYSVPVEEFDATLKRIQEG